MKIATLMVGALVQVFFVFAPSSLAQTERDAFLRTIPQSSIVRMKNAQGNSAQSSRSSQSNTRRTVSTTSNSTNNTINSMEVLSSNKVQGNTTADNKSEISIGNTQVGGQTRGPVAGPTGIGFIPLSTDPGLDGNGGSGDAGGEESTEEGKEKSKLEKDLELAVLSKCVYVKVNCTSEQLGDWKDITQSAIGEIDGLSSGDFQDDSSGSKAALYYNEITGEYVLAFSGSDEKVDYTKGNIPQYLGMHAQQYEQAIKLAQALAKTNKYGQLQYTGHSLGGGLASAASVVTGRNAVTFNAAGLHKKTVKEYSGAEYNYDNAGQLIIAYYIEGDPLSNFQDSVPPPCWSPGCSFLPNQAGEQRRPAIGNRVRLGSVRESCNSGQGCRHDKDHIIESMQTELGWNERK